MKTLLLVRHAKSSWTNDTLTDFDRPLNDRGHEEALAMSKMIFNKNLSIDALISSNANRAFTTCKYFANALEFKEEQIIQVPKLYHAYEDVFYETISEIDDNLNCVALFSHNPGITYFINELTKTKLDDMPTCGVFAVAVDIDNWKKFKQGKKSFLFFEYPGKAT